MTRADHQEFRRAFLGELPEDELIEKLLNYFPSNIHIFIKDSQSRFIMSNRNHWEKMGLNGPEEIVGKTDYDFFWKLQAEAYRHDDAEVMRTGVPQINKPEIIPTADGMVDWYQTTKIPLRGRHGNAAGLIGITQDLRSADSDLHPYRTLEPVVRHIMAHYAKPLRTEELAELAGLSLSRFTRRFKREFQVTPGRYLAMVRLNVACRLLVGTSKPIADIAVEAGFYDHSFFTKQFAKYKKMTPKEFRASFREMPDQKKFFSLGHYDPAVFDDE